MHVYALYVGEGFRSGLSIVAAESEADARVIAGNVSGGLYLPYTDPNRATVEVLPVSYDGESAKVLAFHESEEL